VPPFDGPAGRSLEPLDHLFAGQRLGPTGQEFARRIVGEREADGRFGDVVDRHVSVRRLALAEDLRLPGLPVQADEAGEPDLVEHPGRTITSRIDEWARPASVASLAAASGARAIRGGIGNETKTKRSTPAASAASARFALPRS
jgi:hypothetical protein